MKHLHWTIERDALRGIAKWVPDTFKNVLGFHYDEVNRELLFTRLNMTTGNEWIVAYTRSDASLQCVWREFFTPDGDFWMKTVSFGHELLEPSDHETFKRYLMDIQLFRERARKSFIERVKYWRFTGWWVK